MVLEKYRQADLFGLTPKQLYPYERVEKGKIVVLLPVYQIRADGWFRQKTSTMFLRFKLDLLGSFVWDNCNGKKTVRDIADRMKAEYGNYAEPIDERVGKFVQRLHREKLIDMDWGKRNEIALLNRRERRG